MKLSQWARGGWWAIVVLGLSAFLVKRWPDIVEGRAAAADVVVFLTWLALILAPLFSEVSLFGISLKRDLRDLRDHVLQLRTDIATAVQVRTELTQHLTLPAPVPDSSLPELEAAVERAVSRAIQLSRPTTVSPVQPSADDTAQFLFATRYSIERELRRVVGARQLHDVDGRYLSIVGLARLLVESELVDPDLARATKEIYSICSVAIHGEQVTEAQLAFVHDTAPRVLGALRALI